MSGNVKKFFLFCTGIFVCYFVYGVLQERITRSDYGVGDNAEKFTYASALVFFSCLVNYLFAKALLATVMKQGEDTTSTFYYFSAALTYLLAMVCSYMSLQFVNYPTQVIGKSGKPIPVMILGVLLGNKSYPLKKYLFILCVVLGVALFMYNDKKETTTKNSTGFGELLLILSLIMDGLTSAVQERMKAEYNTRSGHMMLNMNFWSFIFSGIMIVLSGELIAFLGFLQRHPSSIWQILLFTATGAIGQYFIFVMVTDFGPLPCSIVTTTRKFFSVLASVLFFGNALLVRQWLATLLVFLGLFLDSFYGKTSSTKKLIVN